MTGRTVLLALCVLLAAGACGERDTRAPRAVTRVAFGSCAFQWAEQPIWRAVEATEPDLFLFLGDAIYGDFDGERTFDVTEASLRAEWAKLAANPDWQRLAAHVPVLATWDNHDYGHHSAGAEFPLKEMSKTLFLDFFGEPTGSERRTRPGIYDATGLGPPGHRVQVILLDTRTFKSPLRLAERPPGARGSLGKFAPNDDPDATLLGPAQWAWLEARLREPADVRLVASSTQVVADEKGMDEWGGYPRERKRLFDLVRATAAAGVVVLSGNVHFAEVSRTDEGPYPLLDFTSSGLTHVNETYPSAPNRHRVAGPFVERNFGVVEVDWEAPGGPIVRMAAVGVDGRREFEHEVRLERLAPSPAGRRSGK